MGIDIEEFETPQKHDFRRANGAPMIVDKDGKNKRLSRPSSWGKLLDDENALTNWKIDRAAEGVAKDPALQAAYVAVKEGDRDTFKELREKAINAGRGDQAADLGTALHAMSERWEDPDDDFDPPEAFAGPLRLYTETLAEFGLESELFEYAVVNLKRGCAGTADRLYRLTKPLMTPDGEIHQPGELFVGDLKTGKSLDFSLPGYTVQMALYAEGELYDVINDEFLPTPEVNQDWGILVHLPSTGGYCGIVWCDLGVGAYGATLVEGVKQWRRSWKNKEPYGAYDAVLPMSADAVAERLGGEIIDAGHDDWVETMRPFIKARMKNLKNSPDAVKYLQTWWPTDVPPPARIDDNFQITAVLDLLDKVEAEYGITFPEDDPRVTPGAHKSAGPASNTPKEAK